VVNEVAQTGHSTLAMANSVAPRSVRKKPRCNRRSDIDVVLGIEGTAFCSGTHAMFNILYTRQGESAAF